MKTYMNAKIEAYLVIVEKYNPELEIGENLRNTVYFAPNFRKAYDAAIDFGIKNPNRGYKAALNYVNAKYAVIIQDKDTGLKVTIVKVKKIL